jgi:hypothetical protein
VEEGFSRLQTHLQIRFGAGYEESARELLASAKTDVKGHPMEERFAVKNGRQKMQKDHPNLFAPPCSLW